MESTIVVQIKKLFPDSELPVRASGGASGWDVPAYRLLDRSKKKRPVLSDLSEPYIIPPEGGALFGIGTAMAIPYGWEAKVFPRSGLATMFDVELGNSPGTIDADYRGETSVFLRNRSKTEPREVRRGMRIAQMCFYRFYRPVFRVTDELPPTRRNTGGFGSTGFFRVAEGDEAFFEEQRRLDRYFMGIAVATSRLSDCLRGVQRNEEGVYPKDTYGGYVGAVRRIGCVIVKDGTILGQGYNSRNSECDEVKGCIRELLNIPSGTQLERGCGHAEEMALQNHGIAGGPSLAGATVYITAEPCLRCAKLLVGFQIAAIVVPEGVYPTNGLQYLIDNNVEVRHVPLD